MPDDLLTVPLAAWMERGSMRKLAGYEVFVADIGPTTAADVKEPLLVLHGFPTSSFDYADVVDRLAEHRRVILPDFVGYGLSEKPDIEYRVSMQADVVTALTAEIGLDRFALLTHDMGDTVGGELLARQMEGSWPVEITRRVLTNGSIYIDLAHLTDGQKFLLALPDQRLAEQNGAGLDVMAASLAATTSPSSELTGADFRTHAEMIRYRFGGRNLPRLIRYVEERFANERRFTGAIESHPSPLGVVWGADDPIAVLGMVEVLRTARPDLSLTVLDGVGHYPMIEDPGGFGTAVLAALD